MRKDKNAYGAAFSPERFGSFFSFLLVPMLLFSSASLFADAITLVTVDTSQLSGVSAQVAFDLIGGPDANTITLSNFTTDGSLGAVSLIGEASGILPGTVVLTDALAVDFFNEYLTNIKFGSKFSFVLTATTIAPASGSSPDAFSLFIFNPGTGLSQITTSDPTGAGSLLILDIDGSPQGNLNVYLSPSVTVTATPASSTPEPRTMALLAASLGILGLACLRRVSDLLNLPKRIERAN